MLEELYQGWEELYQGWEAHCMQWGRGEFLEKSFALDVDNTIEISHGVTCLVACCVGGLKCCFMPHLPD